MKEKPEERLRKTYRALRAAIYGQEEAVRAAAMMDAARATGDKRHALFVGPTGCGKTEVFRQLGDIAGDVFIIDASGLTAEGWKGEFKIADVFSLALDQASARRPDDTLDEATERVEHGIIVLDEVDKALIPAGGDYTEHIKLQGQMLAILEGRDVAVKAALGTTMVNTSQMCFAFLGAFAELYKRRKKGGGRLIGFSRTVEAETKQDGGVTLEELAEYGLMPELLGRLNSVVELDGMSEDDYLKAMTKRGSVLDRAVEEKRMPISFTDAEIESMAREAAMKNLGLRWIRKQVDRKADELLFERAGIPEMGG